MFFEIKCKMKGYFVMKKKTQNPTENKVTNKVDLHNLLGVEKVANTQVDKKLSEKAQIMKNVNDTMHKLLFT